jgi:tRNA threonylcarbamoyladenosine biosynthesis protein TsaE
MLFRRLSVNSFATETSSPEASEALGFQMGKSLFPGLALLLFGGLGAGKTTLTKGIGRALGIDNIKSPSFIIVSERDGTLPLIHADLYRIGNETGADALALDEYADEGRVIVVEWAERFGSLNLFPERWDIFIEQQNTTDKRLVTVTSHGSNANKALAELADRLELHI